MSTYTQLLYHIIFSTKYRKYVLEKSQKESLFKYISGIIKNLNSVPYRINGVGDHIHILVRIHPTVCLSDFVKNIKTSSTAWIKSENLFPYFTSWQEGYGAFTCSIRQKDRLIKYIDNQEEHHQRRTFIQEYRKLLDKAEIKHNANYLD